jgi:spoIIIJ-associated protein
VVIDVEYYRERRKFKIAQQAKQGAVDALHSGAAVSLTPMNPAERRIAHLTLADDSRVTTFSEGEGTRRRVVIQPADMKKKGHGHHDRGDRGDRGGHPPKGNKGGRGRGRR